MTVKISLLLATLLGALALSAASALAGAPERPVTKPVTDITATSATLNGELNPNVPATTGYLFKYSIGGSCIEYAVTTAAEPESTGRAIKISTPIVDLEGNTEYTVCVDALHAEGEVTESTLGLPVRFKTLPAKPVISQPPSGSSAGPFVENVFESLNSENQPTTLCALEYGKTTAYGSTAPCEPPVLPASSDPQEERVALKGLEASTTYHARMTVKNATGETTSPDGKFTTAPVETPLVDEESVTERNANGATLEAHLNPNYQSSSYRFEYAANEALIGTAGATTLAGTRPLPAGFGDQVASANIAGGMQPGGTYFYRVLATNAAGTTVGTVKSFIKHAPPQVTTGEPQRLTRTGMTFSATVNPGGEPTTYHVAYVPAAEYESEATNPYSKGVTTPESDSVGSDYIFHQTGSIEITELDPGVTYHYAVIATNAIGTTIGPDATVTTAAVTPPVANTGGSENVSQMSATVDGSVDTRGLETIIQFEFGTDPGQGALVPASVTPGPEEGSSENIQASFVGDLQPGTTYYYRAMATNQDGTSYGSPQAFTTPAYPLAFPAATVLPQLPYAPIAALYAKEAKEGKVVTPKLLTRVEKLGKALRACRQEKKSKRAPCERHAHEKYSGKRTRKR